MSRRTPAGPALSGLTALAFADAEAAHIATDHHWQVEVTLIFAHAEPPLHRTLFTCRECHFGEERTAPLSAEAAYRVRELAASLMRGRAAVEASPRAPAP